MLRLILAAALAAAVAMPAQAATWIKYEGSAPGERIEIHRGGYTVHDATIDFFAYAPIEGCDTPAACSVSGSSVSFGPIILEFDHALTGLPTTADGFSAGYAESRIGDTLLRGWIDEVTISIVELDVPPEQRYSVTSVPEPATWAMMIAGFAMVGGALRRHSIVSNMAVSQ